MKGRRRKGYAKNKRKRQLETPKNHSQRFARTVTDFGSILAPKMDTKSHQNLGRKSIPQKSTKNYPKGKIPRSDFCSSGPRGPAEGNIRDG